MLRVVSVLTSNGLLGGVGVWSLRMSSHFTGREGVQWDTLILRNEATEDQSSWFLPAGYPGVRYFDYDSRDKKGLLLKRLARTLADCDTLIPNYVLAAWQAAGCLKQQDASPRLISVLHSDHRLFYSLTEQFAPALDAVVSVSEACRRILCETRAPVRCPVRVIPYGVPVPEEPPDKPPVPPLRLVYAGRLEERQKRVSLLAELAIELRRRGVPFVLDIFGAGPAEPSLRAKLVELSEQVRFHGPAPLHRNAAMYRDEHILVLLSDHEGLPLAVLEAMGYGVVPVVTHVRSGIPEVIQSGKTGYLLPLDRPIEPAVEVLCDLAASPERLRRMGLACHHAVREGYALERSAQRWVELLEELQELPPTTPARGWQPPELDGFGVPNILDSMFVPRQLTLLVRRLRHPSSRSTGERKTAATAGHVHD